MNDLVDKSNVILQSHRKSIDRLDAILVYTLAERFKYTQEVGKLKAKNNLEPSPHETKLAECGAKFRGQNIGFNPS